MESRCRIPIWRTFGRNQWHVIPEPRITMQGAATWKIHCHDSRATCHIAGCSHLTKSMSWSFHIAGCKNSIRHIENRFSPYFFLFLMQFRLWRAAAFVSSPIHLLQSDCSGLVSKWRGHTVATTFLLRGHCQTCASCAETIFYVSTGRHLGISTHDAVAFLEREREMREWAPREALFVKLLWPLVLCFNRIAPRYINTRRRRFPGARERNARNATSSKRLCPCTQGTFEDEFWQFWAHLS